LLGPVCFQIPALSVSLFALPWILSLLMVTGSDAPRCPSLSLTALGQNRLWCSSFSFYSHLPALGYSSSQTKLTPLQDAEQDGADTKGENEVKINKEVFKKKQVAIVNNSCFLTRKGDFQKIAEDIP
jgi:hypothetical protein